MIGFSGDYGPGHDAALDDPTGIALDSKGYLYFCGYQQQPDS